MTFQKWWADPNTGMPFPATGADLQEWCRQAFMAGADAVKSLPHRAMFDAGVDAGKGMAAKDCIEIADGYHRSDPVHFIACAIADTIRKKFGLEI